MAKSAGEFLFEQAKKAGIAETEPFMAALAQNKELFTQTIPDELTTGIDSQLISLKDAKNNHPDISSVYRKQVLDGVDAEIQRILDEVKDDEVKNEVLAEKNSYKRVGLLTKKLRDLEAKKAGANKPDQKALQDQIDQLHAQIRAEKENVVKVQKDADDKVVSFKKDYLIKSMLQGYKTTLDELPAEVRATSLLSLLNKDLQDNKAQFTFDEHDNFVLLKLDGSNYYGDDNKQVDAKAFIEKTLSRNKLLKVNDQSSSNGNGENSNGRQQQNQQQPQGGGAGSNGEQKKNFTLSGLVANSLKDLETNSKVQVV